MGYIIAFIFGAWFGLLMSAILGASEDDDR